VNEIDILILPYFGARKGVDFGSDRVVGMVIVMVSSIDLP
jgi:hypothetical protein